MIALDTNILVYALDDRAPDKKPAARILSKQAMLDQWIVPVQVLAELLAVVARKRPDLATDAIDLVAAITKTAECPSTDTEDIASAFILATRHRLQYFDALIIAVAARAGATTLYSEDMPDGLTIGPLTIRNPFKSETAA